MRKFFGPGLDAHENIVLVEEPSVGLMGVIAIHSTALGPAAGGIRMRPYHSKEEAMDDVLKLSQAMSYKNAIADLPLGGGKSVIMGDPRRDKTPALLEAFGAAIQRLNGAYIGAEDMGIGPADLKVLSRTTRFVAGLPSGPAAVGDPSPVTARGVAEGIAIATRHRLHRHSIAGLTVIVQGVGSVGGSLCRFLAEQGAHLIVTDTDDDALDRIRSATGATVVAPAEIFDQDGDVFAPCAAGGALNRESIARLRAPIVCGAANNQLAGADCEALLAERQILYAPDYVVNGGGIISIASEILNITDKSWVDTKLSRLMRTLDEIFDMSVAQGRATSAIADEMAQRKLSAA